MKPYSAVPVESSPEEKLAFRRLLARYGVTGRLLRPGRRPLHAGTALLTGRLAGRRG